MTDTLRAAEEGEAARLFAATQNREKRQRASAYTTAETILAARAATIANNHRAKLLTRDVSDPRPSPTAA